MNTPPNGSLLDASCSTSTWAERELTRRPVLDRHADHHRPPPDLIDMTRQYQLRLLQQSRMPEKKVEKEEAGDKPSVKLWTREPRRVNVPICVTCSETMLPRNPLAHHLTNQSLRANLC